MKEYIFINDAKMVNRETGLNEMLRKGTVRSFDDKTALTLMSIAIITPYKPPKHTIGQLKTELDELGVEYNPKSKKHELLDLVEEAKK